MSLDQGYENLQLKTNSLITFEKIHAAKEFMYLSRLVLNDNNANIFFPPDGLGARVQHKHDSLTLESVTKTSNNGYYDENFTRIGLLYSDLAMYYEIDDERVKQTDTISDSYLQFILDSFRSHYS